ncbi:hypothetical protein Poli38472_005227 [Pythium oligandrum]|uniref:Uncharacterized protein n=1 Tax=Pythium oligandrum TaxID=41045 RepID=A0A8K1FJ04_PYTOL|nr:hypothetical protein Poli38472_005227 [Pythium oligandrum]|eukprot:TMW62609.1 hypothetical protein Poli38472_005227 [Pythium oligandrum]
MADAMKKVLHKTTALWERFQIEFHGQYSVERLHQMKIYTERTSWSRLALAYCLSIMPCLVVNIGLECIPLRPISEGLAGSTTFFIRSGIVLHFMGFLAFQHYRQLIPELPSSLKQICVMTSILAMGTLLNEYLFARWIGYPVPFLVIVVAPTYMTFLLLNVGVVWGKFLRANKSVFWELVHLQVVLTVIFSLAFAYPVYNCFFVRISPAQQTWFTLLLPLIKILAKNAVSPFCKYIEDYKPEAVIFNMEIFHAYFVSMCMQSATSFRTTALLMLMDFVHAWLSLRDITVIVDEIQTMRTTLTGKRQLQGLSEKQSRSLADLPAHVLFLVKTDPKLVGVANIRLQSRWTMRGPSHFKAPHSIVPVIPVGHEGLSQKAARTGTYITSHNRTEFDVATIAHNLPEAEQKILLQTLDVKARAQYVAHVLKLLHTVEFLVLIEFTEVIIPFVYSVYLYATYLLPNHVYHTQLRDVDASELRRTLGHVMVYASLELVSLLIFQFFIYRKIRISPAHQLAFVLEKQWTLVQLKLCVWFLFIIQFSMDHFGNDYSFTFAWLKQGGIVLHFMGFLAFQHYRQLIPELPSSLTQICVMTVVLALGTLLNEYLFARWIGYPVPFLVILAAPTYMTLLLLNIGVWWGKFLRANNDVFWDLVHLQVVLTVIFSLAFAYPVYNYFFVRISPVYQPWFTMLLPLIKILDKNAVSPFCKYIEDYKPEAVIFNIEIFHAYFVSVCMQSATSFRTTALLMLMDLVHAWLSLRDITLIVDEIQTMRTTLTGKRQLQGLSEKQSRSLADLPAHVLFLVKTDPKLVEVANIRLQTRWAMRGPASLFLSKPSDSVVPSGDGNMLRIATSTASLISSRRRTEFDLTSVEHNLPETEQRNLLQTLDVNARAHYVASVLKLLHMVEFLVLIEFTEVIIPFVYSVYLYATYLLPNHVYHTQLRDVDASELRRTLGNVMVYAGLELVSLLIFQFLIYRKIRISPAHQLAFVLEKQWTLVQLKLCVWFLFIIQFSVDHFGADYSFTFAWLKHKDAS